VTGPAIRPWVILAEGKRLRWGGDLRRHYIFSELARRTGGRIVDGWHARDFRPALRRPRGHLWTRPARVASCELLDPAALEVVQRRAIPAVLDLHDDPVIHREALGLVGEDAETRELRARRDASLAAFRWLVAPSGPFARLAGLDPDRVIVAPNGSDTSVVRPEPWPAAPTVGLISGAAPARGIETLIDAVREIRVATPGVRLLLWLAATGEGGERYLDNLKAVLAGEGWIEFGSAPYQRIGVELGRASVLVIPTPPHAYWDSVAPIKLFDCMAAARPIVTSPRLEPARLVEAARAGVVARGDSAADLAAAIDPLIRDEAVARRLGANGRAYVRAEHEWRHISARLADQLLAPRRYHPVLGILRRC
jgi:glycosyltransferase involved in cell wall biosynthesis